MSSIVTFYSYKGGVGRSMALANIAFELAKRNKKVLIVDWDLEAPGLEKYFSSFSITKATAGLLQLLLEFQNNTEVNYKNYISTINTPTDPLISLLQSGRDENDPTSYTSNLEKFNWEIFFRLNQGGLHLEKLREQWLNDFDIVLIDSRTGLSDSSGICTILMPDILIPMFTANYQSLFGIRDIVKYIQSSRQGLSFERMALTILPIPSRFGTRVEFKESQEWLSRIADILKDCFTDWLPSWIEPRYILEQVKIPQIDYFSFGEKLAVVEQGTNDPEGMGFIYSKIASLLASDFTDIKSFVGNDYYISKKEEYEVNYKNTGKEIKSEYIYDIFISYPRVVYQWVKDLLLPTLTEYLNDILGYNPKIFIDLNEINGGELISQQIENALEKSRTLLFVFTSSDYNSYFFNFEMGHLLKREALNKNNLIFPVKYDISNSDFINLSEIFKDRYIIDFSKYIYEDTLKSTKLRVQFGQEVEKLAVEIGNSILNIPFSSKKIKKSNQKSIELENKNNLSEILQLAKEYEEIRENMIGGNSRTKLMAKVLVRMKSLIIESDNILPKFTESKSAGERLVAIAKLQKFPSLDYLEWLANHVGDSEKPFIGYQAFVALYIATKAFGNTNKLEISNALIKAEKNLNKYRYKDPNQIDILKSAKTELKIN
ncbi:MAG TPA: AAA family ATPase [Saprospiraceae bacterium]|nr:AAA family ATPase [Saprospiraceae bacterium]